MKNRKTLNFIKKIIKEEIEKLSEVSGKYARDKFDSFDDDDYFSRTRKSASKSKIMSYIDPQLQKFANTKGFYLGSVKGHEDTYLQIFDKNSEDLVALDLESGKVYLNGTEYNKYRDNPSKMKFLKMLINKVGENYGVVFNLHNPMSYREFIKRVNPELNRLKPDENPELTRLKDKLK